MSQKRQQPDGGASSGGSGGGGSPEEKRQKVPTLQRVLMEAIMMQNVQKILNAAEPLIRRVVKEEIESALAKHLVYMKRSCGKQIYPSTSKSLQLKFINKLSLPIFTGTKIEGEESSSIHVALVDALTGEVVTSGPESSMKVDIVVLDGDFEGEGNNWTVDEFKNNIVREREGRRALLLGSMTLELHEGVGTVGDLSFTDNSSWTRSRKFRLGARVVDGHFNGMRVKEAMTDAFIVKDHRGELYRKHYPPSLVDDVWRLEKIGKDGAFHKRLSMENIHTVKDFLTLLGSDSGKLRSILGSCMSAKMWELTVEHARTCTLGNQVHVYYPSGQGKMGVVFNIVGELMGVVTQQEYVSSNGISCIEKADAQSIVKAAFKHWENVLTCDIETITSDNRGLSSSPLFDSQLLTDNVYNTFSPNMSAFNCPQASSSFSDVFSIEGMRSLDSCLLQATDSELDSSDLLGSDDTFQCLGDLERTSHDTIFMEDSFLYPDPIPSLLLSHGVVGPSPANIVGSAVTGILRSTAIGKAKAAGWRTLVYLLQWRFSIRRIVASKKKRKSLERRIWLGT